LTYKKEKVTGNFKCSYILKSYSSFFCDNEIKYRIRMNYYDKSAINKVVRSPARGQYDHETVHKILDSQFLCHVAYEFEGTPIAIPTAYGRKGQLIYLHGAKSNRMLGGIVNAQSASLTVTALDGIVLARSVFHHSFNYRSVVVFGKVREVTDPAEAFEALAIITENIVAGRWDEARLPNEKELKTTLILALEITSASAKIRTGDPKDDEADYDLPIWAGVLPIHTSYGEPINDAALKGKYDFPDSIKNLRKK